MQTSMSDQTGLLIQKTMAGDLRAFAKLLTALEREGPRALSQNPALLRPPSEAFRFGLTGPPGAGKSTLIGQLIGRLRKSGRKVGVIAVDPSSPFTQGAILGDRIRYTEHFGDQGVFIRSLGSRGSFGGLSSSAYLMVRAFDLADFDIVLLETVGVGQTELEIMNVADSVAVALVPESGDSIQGMKAGLLEIADFFIVNKSDRPGADSFARELEASLFLDPRAHDNPIPIFKTTAIDGAGVEALFDHIVAQLNDGDWRARRREPKRLQAEAKALMRNQLERAIELKSTSIANLSDFAAMFQNEIKIV
jgi:LAO/AO transport system kinase